MLRHFSAVVALGLAVAVLSGSAQARTKVTKVATPTKAAAKEPVAAKPASHQGVVVSAGKGKLMMTDAGSTKEHSHDVASTAKITVDGKAAKLEDLKTGMTVTVTTEDGKVVSISGEAAKLKTSVTAKGASHQAPAKKVSR